MHASTGRRDEAGLQVRQHGGPWGVVRWSERGLFSVGWPGEAQAGSGDDPPKWVRALGRKLERHHAGKPQSYNEIALDAERLPPFHLRVYEALRGIPAGRTCSYAELAALAGSPGAMRAVGQAMARNPFPVVVPCHRVLAGGTGAGGFSAPGGVATKARLLADEGVLLPVTPQPVLDARAAERHLRAVDPVLARVIARVGPCRLGERPREGTPFESLAKAILYQQLNGKAAATIHARVLALFPRRRMEPDALLGLRPEALRGAGVSASKLAALLDLSARAARGEVPGWNVLERAADRDIVVHLSRVRGIGAWTVQMMLMFDLRRQDVLPVEDFAVRLAFSQLYGVEGPAVRDALVSHAERWRPFRGAAAWYLWQSLAP